MNATDPSALLARDQAVRADPAAQLALTLAKELWLLRDRQIVLEAMLAEKGITSSELIDAWQPTPAVKERLARERKRFLEEVQSALSPAPEPTR
jgi:hypothetical protein